MHSKELQALELEGTRVWIQIYPLLLDTVTYPLRQDNNWASEPGWDIWII